MIPLFSYGALQDIGVQEQFLGRTVDGTPDHLPGFVLTVAELDDTDLIAATGSARHPMAVLGTSSGTRVRGTVYLLTEAELDAVDRHSGVGFHRVPVELGSGITAWAYVDRRYRPPLLSRGAVPAESQELAA
ncbi:gamma-glutamylcyclotransferase family protein [Streptomyces sp. NPDC088387]|uniref:gamma-glutamylcyclotransferase family protein n=1 Tax=Streptomyces sp. NPDC088387 TaxID=3365859 RepID=UPI0037F378F1